MAQKVKRYTRRQLNRIRTRERLEQRAAEKRDLQFQKRLARRSAKDEAPFEGVDI